MRNYSAEPVGTGGIGGGVVGEYDEPLTVLTLTAQGAAMGSVDHDYSAGADAVQATLWRNHKAARVYRVGRP